MAVSATPQPWPSLIEAVLGASAARYGWRVEADWLVWLPGLVTGLNVACRAVDGDVLTATPVYPPFLSAPRLSGRQLVPPRCSSKTAAGAGILPRWKRR
jgi:bifunctional pyridoxal-dependent enzyme with beta-cystathionase and maltose regulon repressor activities